MKTPATDPQHIDNQEAPAPASRLEIEIPLDDVKGGACFSICNRCVSRCLTCQSRPGFCRTEP